MLVSLIFLLGTFVIIISWIYNWNPKDTGKKFIFISKTIEITNKKWSENLVNIRKSKKLRIFNNDIIRHSFEINNNNVKNSGLLLPGDIWILELDKSEYVITSTLYDDMEKLVILRNNDI